MNTSICKSSIIFAFIIMFSPLASHSENHDISFYEPPYFLDAQSLAPFILTNGVIKKELDTLFSDRTKKPIDILLEAPTFTCIQKPRTNIVGYFDMLPKVILKTRFPSDRKGSFSRKHDGDATNIYRVIYAEHFRTIITVLNLSSLVIPKKHLYHLPGKPTTLCDVNYLVIAEKLPAPPPETPTISHLDVATWKDALDDFFIFIAATAFDDPHPGNVIPFFKDNKPCFGIVDTEPIDLLIKQEKNSGNRDLFIPYNKGRIIHALHKFGQSLIGEVQTYWRKKTAQFRAVLKMKKLSIIPYTIF